jgi:hypothetical protein
MINDKDKREEREHWEVRQNEGGDYIWVLIKK